MMEAAAPSRRSWLVLGGNLVLGAGVLAWALWRFGRPALGVLSAPSPLLLAAFFAAVVAGITGFAWRWRMLLVARDLQPPLAPLTCMRAAGQSVSTLVPSARLSGDPVRAWLLLRSGAPTAPVVASVAVDRILEMGAGAPFTLLFATVLVQEGVPELRGAFVSVTAGVLALAVGVAAMARRLRGGAGLVTPIVRRTGLDRLAAVQRRVDVLAASEAEAAALVARPAVLWRAYGVGLALNVGVVVEYGLLLAAFGLPWHPVAVVGAIFASGAAHALPVPAGVGVLEGAQMWMFAMLGYPPEIGLAVGLAVRLRELAWVLPGLVYLSTVALGRRPQTAPA